MTTTTAHTTRKPATEIGQRLRAALDIKNGQPPANPYAGKRAFRIDEACHALGISRSSLYELIKSGDVKMIRIAGRSLIPASEIDRLTHVDEAA